MLLVKGICVHFPFENVPPGNWLVREPELFHVTLRPSPRIDFQMIINILRQLLYDPEVELFTFCPQLLKTFRFKGGKSPQKKKKKRHKATVTFLSLLSFEVQK